MLEQIKVGLKCFFWVFQMIPAKSLSHNTIFFAGQTTEQIFFRILREDPSLLFLDKYESGAPNTYVKKIDFVFDLIRFKSLTIPSKK